MIKPKIVCTGDSLTEGYGLPQIKRWSNLLEEDLGAEFINSGISGDSTAGMLARFHPMVIAHNPTHVIIMGGTNDLASNLSQELILSNIITMARQARHFGIIPIIGIPTPIILNNVYIPSEIFLPAQDMHRELIKLRANLMLLAEEKGIPIIDFTHKMHVGLFLEDGVHPNELGQRLMKEYAKKVLKEEIAYFRG